MQKSEMMAKLNRIYQNLHSLNMPTSEQNVMLMADCYLALKKLYADLQENIPNVETVETEDVKDGEETAE